MWFTKRYNHAQIKVNKLSTERARDAEIKRMISEKDTSWSALMPPYYGTILCPVKTMRGN